MVESSEPVVQTAGLCKTFKDFWRRPRVEAVKDLNLRIKPGEIFGLLGPNGSGKTTTIKMLLGLLYPTKGRISLFGKPPTDVSVKARIGFLPEESYLYRFLVAEETLDFYGRLFRIPKRIRRERIDRLLDMVGLQHEATRRMGEYSKGMARRIGLAQALINDPEFLILDEPTSGLDPIGARQIKDLIRELGRKGKTILLSSHILADVEDVCDRVAILYGGQERAAGDIGELLSQTDQTQITMPSLSKATLDSVRDLVFKMEQKDIIDVTNPRVRLEDFFLQIVEEAQAANIETSGARASGALPDFLKQPTKSSVENVVDDLVSASVGTQAPETVVPTVSDPVDEAAQEVIEDLLGSGQSASDDVSEPEDAVDAPSVSRDSDHNRPGISADADVIDDLLGRSDQPDSTERESQP